MKRLLTTLLVFAILATTIEVKAERFTIIEGRKPGFSHYEVVIFDDDPSTFKSLREGESLKVTRACMLESKIECCWFKRVIEPELHITGIRVRPMSDWKPRLVLVILGAATMMKKRPVVVAESNCTENVPAAADFILVELRYPYGKDKLYMNGSTVSVAAILTVLGTDIWRFN